MLGTLRFAQPAQLFQPASNPAKRNQKFALLITNTV